MIENNLDVCFETLIELNFEEDNQDLLFASAAELEKIHSGRPPVPDIKMHLVENLTSDNSKSDKDNLSQHRSGMIGHFTPGTFEEDPKKSHERPKHLTVPKTASRHRYERRHM